MTQPVLQLKKYANRRLYDAENSRHITLEQVAANIRDGRLVQVVDAKTGEDVTAFILTQIVLEEAKNRNSLLPVPLLHLIIRYGDNLLLEFFEKYLQQTIAVYLDHKKAVDAQFSQWLDMGRGLSEMTKQTMGQIDPMRAFMEVFTGAGSKKE